MSQSDYFENTAGTGILATANSDGNVDVAVYANPHMIDEQTVAFIMNERLSYQNITSNPKLPIYFWKIARDIKAKDFI